MKADFETIYEHIGYLFYALASEQCYLSEYDLHKLKTDIAEKWQPLPTSDPALHLKLVRKIHDGIMECYIDELSGLNAFEMFENYYLVHHLNFGNALRDNIVATSNLISRLFFHTSRNNHESEVLRELKTMFRFSISGHAGLESVEVR